jgi:hypothetical protein
VAVQQAAKAAVVVVVAKENLAINPSLLFKQP